MSVKIKLDVYPIENYLVTPNETAEKQQTIIAGNRGHKNHTLLHGKVELKLMKTPREKLFSLRKRCAGGQRVESVEGVLLVHLHRHPHVLLLKQRLSRKPDEGLRIVPSAAVNSPDFAFRLPGGRCQKGEKAEDCLLRKLGRQLQNKDKTSASGVQGHSDTIVDVGSSANFATFRVGEILGEWFRPQLSPLMYPYVPPHTSPDAVKEVRTIFLVHMGRNIEFQIPHADVELVAVPLFDLYDNTGKYGPEIASLPVALSRVYINCCGSGEF